MSVQRAIALAVVCAAFSAGGCIIGPKQDDPLVDRELTDAGSILDGSLGAGADSSIVSDTANTVPYYDAAADASGDVSDGALESGDAADAPGDSDSGDAAAPGDADSGDAAEGG